MTWPDLASIGIFVAAVWAAFRYVTYREVGDLKDITVTGYLKDGTRVSKSFLVNTELEFSARVNAWADDQGVVEWRRDSTI